MGQRFVLWLGRAGRCLVGGFFTVIFYLIVMVLLVAVMELTNDFVIVPAINNFGRATVMSAMILIAVATLVGAYTVVAVTLWQRFPTRPMGTGRFHWLLIIYGKSWWRGLSQDTVHKLYFILGLVICFGLIFELLIGDEPSRAVLILAAGLITPGLAVTTCFQPLLGSIQPEEAVQKT